MLLIILISIILVELFYWLVIRPYRTAYYEADKITQEQVVYLIVNGNFRFKELERHKGETDMQYRKRIKQLYEMYRKVKNNV